MGKVAKLPFGSRIREERQAWGWSQSDLAEAAGMSKSNLWEIENDRTDPRISTVVRLADALGMSIAKLITGKDDGYRKGYNAALKKMRDYVKTMGQ